MRIAFVSESSSDESALHGFCEELLGRTVVRVDSPVEIRRGWPALKQSLPPALRAIRFKTDADLVVIVADADGAVLDPNAPTNRLAEIETLIQRTLSPSAAARTLSYAFGLAVPCIEAWWLAHKHSDINEAAWLKRHERPCPYLKSDLKRRLYGSDKVSLPRQTELMTAAARESAHHTDALAQRFPLGLSNLVRTIREFDGR